MPLNSRVVRSISPLPKWRENTDCHGEADSLGAKKSRGMGQPAITCESYGCLDSCSVEKISTTIRDHSAQLSKYASMIKLSQTGDVDHQIPMSIL